MDFNLAADGIILRCVFLEKEVRELKNQNPKQNLIFAEGYWKMQGYYTVQELYYRTHKIFQKNFLKTGGWKDLREYYETTYKSFEESES